jgi:phosphoserine phosphatase
MHNESKRSVWTMALAVVFAFALVLVGCAGTGGNVSGATTESTANVEQTTAEQGAQASSEPADAANADTAFPSWNKDSKSLKAFVDYVNSVTDESSPDYVAPEDRIATFDMDGTIIGEKAPHYLDYCLLLHRVLDNPSYNEPEYKPSEETVKICQGIRDTINSGGKLTDEQKKDKARLIASEFVGLTPEQYQEFARNFLQSVDAVGFDGMKYSKSFYKPMLEVIRYLQANDFDVWMVSACEREFVRAAVPLEIDIAPDRIIGTDVAYASTNQGDTPYNKYNMTQEDKVVLSEPKGQETAEAGKPIAIAREIGKRPILAFGNSSGDYSMLNYAKSNPDHKGMGVLVLCDDTVREYGDAERAQEQTAEAEEEGWVLFHMCDEDWATIYGEGVTKTQLPGVSTEKKDESKTEANQNEEKEELAAAA